MKPAFSCFLALVLSALGYGATNPASRPTPHTAKEVAQGYREHVILAQPRAAHRQSVDAVEARAGVRLRARLSRLNDVRVIELDSSDNADAAIARLRASGEYEYVEPDYLVYLQATPNDPKYIDGSLWAFNNTGQPVGSITGVAGADIKAASAWDIIREAPNVVVAVVDTGINLNHQDLAGNLWTNPNPTNADVHGANFVGGNGQLVSGDPSDDDGHGTHIAGTIGAVGNNGLAVAGIAWKVKLMAVKVFPANAAGSTSEIAAGVNYAISRGAHIINASYGAQYSSPYSQTAATAITAARNAGIIFVAAAGNDTSNMDISRFYPASYPLDNVVAVGASTNRDEVATFSNYGAAVELFAPGDDIVSLYYGNNTGTLLSSGTSMAAPHVSGALALLKAQFPNDNYRQLINRLLRGVDRSDRFTSKAQTGGRLNVYRALTTTTNRPFNDDFGDRPRLASDNLAIRASSTGASSESFDPTIAGFAASSTVWWEWTAPASGLVTVSTSSADYDTLLGIYSGTSSDALTLVAANDDNGGSTASRLSFTAQSGTTYQICLAGKNGTAGLALLTLGTTPANDAFATPVTLTGESTLAIATNANCSRESGEPRIQNFNGGTSLWYRWTAPRSGRFQVAAVSDDFDPLLAVYTGDALTALTLVTASDNTGPDNAETGALCTIDATAGTTYRITVDSKGTTAVGQFTLSIADSLWQITTAGSVTGSPAVGADGTVYFGSTDRSVYAVAPDGTQKWTYAAGGSIDTNAPAIADDGTIYVGANDGKLYAFTPTGARKWVRDFGSGSVPVGAGCSPAIATDGTIYLRVTDGYLYALNPADGSNRWRFNINSATPTFYGNPVIGPDGTIYQGSDEADQKLYAVNPNGTPKWQQSLNSGVYGAPAIDSAGNVYAATLTGGVYSFTPAGGQRWQVSSGGNISSSIALSSDGSTLYYAGYDAKLYARNTASGSVRWTYSLGSEVRASSPAIDGNGVIYIGCYDSKLHAVNPDGTSKRIYAMGNVLRSPPVIAGTRLYVGSNDQKLYAFDLSAGSAGGPWPQYRHNSRRLGRAVSDTLAITAQPQSQTAVIGLSMTLSVTATGQGPLTYQWRKDGVALPGATAATYSVANVSTANAGAYTVVVSGPQGSVTSNPATVTVDTIKPGRLINVSVRTTAGTGDQTLTVGFGVAGAVNKPLLIRGIGPTLLPFGVADALLAPQLKLIAMNSGAALASNTKWGGSQTMRDTFDSVGAFGLDAGSADTALVASVPAAGATYSVQITGANNTTGTALAEIYDLDSMTATGVARLVNVSARAHVGTGGNILIAGFVISGNVPKQVLVRGVGPGLVPYGVAGALADPQLEVHGKGLGLVASNDDWEGATTITTTGNQVGAFPLSTSSFDSALLLTLQPGEYTASVSGLGGTTGVALVEVYEVP